MLDPRPRQGSEFQFRLSREPDSNLGGGIWLTRDGKRQRRFRDRLPPSRKAALGEHHGDI